MLICGGVNSVGSPGIPVCEIFDSTTQSFTSLDDTPLTGGGEGMMSTVLPDGSVLLLGGMSSGVARSEVYLYVP